MSVLRDTTKTVDHGSCLIKLLSFRTLGPLRPTLSPFFFLSLCLTPACLFEGLRGELQRARRPGGPGHGGGRRVWIEAHGWGLRGLHGHAREEGKAAL